MSKPIFFYQNNSCVILKEVTESIVEIEISHKFAESMELRGQCQGCCIGDSDNKIPCTCDDFSWIIEEVQEEENKLVVMVEKRLLAKSPVEQVKIDKLLERISSIEFNLERTKGLHREWEQSLKDKKSMFFLLSDEIELLEKREEHLKSVINGYNDRALELQNKIDETLVYLDFGNKKISHKELSDLRRRDEILSALEGGGVDNWEWYSESLEKAGIDND